MRCSGKWCMWTISRCALWGWVVGEARCWPCFALSPIIPTQGARCWPRGSTWPRPLGSAALVQPCSVLACPAVGLGEQEPVGPWELRAPWLAQLPAWQELTLRAEEAPYITSAPDLWGLSRLTALVIDADCSAAPLPEQLCLPCLQRLKLYTFFPDERLPASLCLLTSLTRLVVCELAAPAYRSRFAFPRQISALTNLQVWGGRAFAGRSSYNAVASTCCRFMRQPWQLHVQVLRLLLSSNPPLVCWQAVEHVTTPGFCCTGHSQLLTLARPGLPCTQGRPRPFRNLPVGIAGAHPPAHAGAA